MYYVHKPTEGISFVAGEPQKKYWKLPCLLYILLMLLGMQTAHAQNLVINPSFEETINNRCPTSVSDPVDQLSPNCVGWFSGNLATPDYFNACNLAVCNSYFSNYDKPVGVPQNTFGYQEAYGPTSDPRQAYAGLIYSRGGESTPANRREYLEGSFTDSLEKDQFYEVSFYVSLAGGSSFALTDLGAYIRRGSYVQGDMLPINVQPQIHDNSRFFDDTTNWMRISGLYRATGGEDHIIIGSFKDTFLLNVDYQNVIGATSCYGTGTSKHFCYYYVDSVSVKKVFDCCEALGVKVDMPPVSQYPCCRRLSVYKLPELLCDVYGVTVTGNSGGIPLQCTPLTLNDINNATQIAIVCPEPGESRMITVEFLDKQGNALCTKTVVIECPSGNSCCDAIGIKIDTAATTHTCCRSLSVYRKSSSLNCSIHGIRVVGATGGIPLQTMPIPLNGLNDATYLALACAETGESKTVVIEFLDQPGNVICTKTVTLSCPVLNKCCDALRVKVDTLEEASQPCCRRISIYKLPQLNCPVYGISVEGAEGGIPWQTMPIVLNDSNNATEIAIICPKAGQEWNVAVNFLDIDSNIICFKQVSGHCPEAACCSTITLGIEPGISMPSNPNCCESIYAMQPAETDCKVYGVNVWSETASLGGIEWDSSRVITFPSCGTCIRRTIASYCLQPGETTTITIEFLDQDGDVMCTRKLVRSCPNICCDKLGVKSSLVGIGTQPCCRQIGVYKLDGLECDVYGITVTGASGSIPLQTTPITLSDSSNATNLVTVCPTPGETRTITIEFLDQDGKVICTKTVTVHCSSGGGSSNKQGESSNNAPGEVQTPVLQSYPNPTTGETFISYELQKAGKVKLELFDPTGRLAGVIEEGERSQGAHTIRYQAESLPQGMYLIRLTTPEGIVSLPLVISKK
jgi:hypothetical protein